MFKLETIDQDGKKKEYKAKDFNEVVDLWYADIEDVKVKSTLRIYLGKGVKEILLYPRVVRKLKMNDLFRDIYRKQIGKIFGVIQ